MKNFRCFNLAVGFYKHARTLRLPRHLKDQLNRAASSIALNLAEGRGKRTTKDQVRYFYIALGSIRECQAIMHLADFDDVQSIVMLDKLGAHVFKLIQNAE